MAHRQLQSPADVFTSNLGTGAVAGALAYVAGFVITYLFAVLDGISTGGQVATWKVVGWVFYAAHNVDMEVSLSGGGQSQTQTFDIFAQANNAGASGLTSTVPGIVYKLLPVVLLVAAGFVVYGQVANRSSDVAAGAAAGATVVVGYLVLGVVGRFLFAISQSQEGFGQTISQSVSPALVTTVLLLGLAYPLILGGIGGALGSQ